MLRKLFICLFIIGFLSSAHPGQINLQTEELKKIEEQFIEQLIDSNKILHDHFAQLYIQQFGNELLPKDIRAEKRYNFFVVKDPAINAFAGPGGHIGVNTGLIIESTSESELAAVLSHEIAHLTQDHLRRQLANAKQAQIPLIASSLAAIALSTAHPAIGASILMNGMADFVEDGFRYSRNFEMEADRIGIRLLYNADYNPSAMANSFKTIQAKSRLSAKDIPYIFRTHPLDEQRIADAENRAAQFKQKKYRKNGMEFKFFQEYLKVTTSSDLEQTLKYYQQQLATQPSTNLKFAYALALQQASQYKASYIELNDIPKQYWQLTIFALSLAKSEIECGLVESAIKRLKQQHQQHPDNSAITLAYADSLKQAKKTLIAEQILQQAVYDDQQNSELWEQLAHLQALNNKKSEAYYSMGRSLVIEQNYQLAMKQFDNALSIVGKQKLLKAKIVAMQDEIQQNNFN